MCVCVVSVAVDFKVTAEPANNQEVFVLHQTEKSMRAPVPTHTHTQHKPRLAPIVRVCVRVRMCVAATTSYHNKNGEAKRVKRNGGMPHSLHTLLTTLLTYCPATPPLAPLRVYTLLPGCVCAKEIRYKKANTAPQRGEHKIKKITHGKAHEA